MHKIRAHCLYHNGIGDSDGENWNATAERMSDAVAAVSFVV